VWLFQPPFSKGMKSLHANPRHLPFSWTVPGGSSRLSPSHNFAIDTMNKKILLIAQILMTFMMALLMSGIMSLIALGPTKQWLSVWPIQFIIAWPIAFILTQFTSKIAFALAPKLAAKV